MIHPDASRLIWVVLAWAIACLPWLAAFFIWTSDAEDRIRKRCRPRRWRRAQYVMLNGCEPD
jgi:hypothetical protein